MNNSIPQNIRKRIQEVKTFIEIEINQEDIKIDRYQAFLDTKNSLDDIEKSLIEKRLKIRIVADDISFSHKLKSVLESCLTITESYHLNIGDLDKDFMAEEIILLMLDTDLLKPDFFQVFLNRISERHFLRFICILNTSELEDSQTQETLSIGQKLYQFVCKAGLENKIDFLYLSLNEFEKQDQSEHVFNQTGSVLSKNNLSTSSGTISQKSRSRIRSRRGRLANSSSDSSPSSKLAEHLSSIAQTESYDLLIKPIKTKILEKLNILDQVFSNELKSLYEKISRIENELNGTSKINIQQKVGIEFRKAEQTIQKSFGQAKDTLNNLKNLLLDNYDSRSAKVKIGQYIDSLKVVSHHEKGRVILELEAANESDVHDALISLICNDLNHWSNQYWNKVLSDTNSGDFDNLCSEIKKRLCLSQLLNHHESLQFEVKDSFIPNIEHLFSAKYKSQFLFSRKYKYPSLIVFVTKELRTNLMQVAGFVLLLSYALDLFFSDDSSSLGRTAMKGIAILLFSPFALHTSVRAFFQGRSEAQDKELEKLIQGGNKHYSSIATTYVNKFAGFVNWQLDEAEQNLKNELNELRLGYGEIILEIENQITTHKITVKQLEETKARLSKLCLSVREV